MTLTKEDQSPLQKLKNVNTVGFYCCKNVDAILPVCSSMPLTLIFFELSDVSPESLKALANSSSIVEIVFEQNLTEDQVTILKSYPANIKITSSFPLDAYD